MGIRPAEIVVATEARARELTQQGFVGISGIGSGYGVAPELKSIGPEASEKTVQEEAVIAHCEHDFSGSNLMDGTACDLNYIAGPQRGQHAFAAYAKPQASSGTQALDG